MQVSKTRIYDNFIKISVMVQPLLHVYVHYCEDLADEIRFNDKSRCIEALAVYHTRSIKRVLHLLCARRSDCHDIVIMNFYILYY